MGELVPGLSFIFRQPGSLTGRLQHGISRLGFRVFGGAVAGQWVGESGDLRGHGGR